MLKTGRKKKTALTSLWFIFKWEVYMEIGFLFHFREWISWLQIVLYHLVALISSSERQDLFFIMKTTRRVYPSSSQNGVTISISAPVFKQQPPGHLTYFPPILIYTWNVIIYQGSALNSKENSILDLGALCQRIWNYSVHQSKPDAGQSFCSSECLYTYEKFNKVLNQSNEFVLADGGGDIQC